MINGFRGSVFKATSFVVLFACINLVIISAFAAPQLPGSADVNRVKPLPEIKIEKQKPAEIKIPKESSFVKIPESAKAVRFVLNDILLTNAHVFSENELDDIYRPFLGKEVTLDYIWQFAGQITERYRQKGFFLSRAYVPLQEINNGVVSINIVEGYISDIEMTGDSVDSKIIKNTLAKLKAEKPLNSKVLESTILRLNELPELTFKGYLEPAAGKTDQSVKLTLNVTREKSETFMQVSNYGSLYLGPWQAMISNNSNLIEHQNTSLTLLSSIPAKELKYVSLAQTIPLNDKYDFQINTAYATSSPGEELEVNDIINTSTSIGFSFIYKPIRQRQKNLTLSIEFDYKDTNGDILQNTPLTKDNMRAIRVHANFDTNDRFNGYNYIDLGYNQGIDVLGASNKGDLNLSRAEAEPNFSSVTVRYIRQQWLSTNWLTLAGVSGQWASGPLFSSEEFGYGGQSFGRAYDSSEITGDHGLAGMVELRYFGLKPWKGIQTKPFAFYDLGKIWNEDKDSNSITASSAGFGFHSEHKSNTSASFTMAWPLTKKIDNPIYGNNKSPRAMLQISYKL